MNDETSLLVGVTEGIATLQLNRPKQKNALDEPMKKALREAVLSIRADRSIRAVILCGSGANFCSGGDIHSMSVADAQAGRERIDDLHGWVSALLDLDRPVIAAVDGVVYGAGFSLALLTDFIVAAPGARFCMPFLKLGLVPDCGALYTLPRVVGMARAKSLVYSAREIDAEEAKQMGAVFEIVPQSDLLVRAQQLATHFAGASAVAFGLAKRAMNQSFGSDLRMMLEVESLAQGVAYTTEYHKDAVRRFKQKQPLLFDWPV